MKGAHFTPSLNNRATRFIDPQVLSRINNLYLIAKTVVEGFITGLHRSPYHGFSLDFAEYREYSPGDDIRTVDWKVYGRSDRFYVKKYEGETNTQVHILLDASRSMAFSSQQVSKLDYARYLAASLAYFAVRQKDSTGLLTFDSNLWNYTPPRMRHGHFFTLLHQLEHLQVGKETSISGAMEHLAGLAHKRGLVILISDFYQEVSEIAKGLRFFQYRGNDVILFHILDPAELEMPLAKVSLLEDMETADHLTYIPEYSRRAYLDLLQEHIGRLRKECRDIRIDYELLNTRQPLDRALHRYLAARERKY